MIQNELFAYIKSSIEQNVSLEEIIVNLEASGWRREEIIETYNNVKSSEGSSINSNNNTDSDAIVEKKSVKYQVNEKKMSHKIVKIALIGVVFLGLVGSGLFLFASFQKRTASPDQERTAVTNEIFSEVEGEELNSSFEPKPRLLFSIPEGLESGSFTLMSEFVDFKSLDFVYSVKISGINSIFINNNTPIEKKGGGYFEYRRDGTTAYDIKENGSVYVVSGNVKYGPYEDRIDNLRFLPDGRLVFSAKRDGKWYLLLNGKEGKAYDYLKDVDVAFSPIPNGEIAYKARGIPDSSDNPYAEYPLYINNHFFIVDGVDHTMYFNVSNGEYSEDGLVFAYVASRIYYLEDFEIERIDQTMVVNGVEETWYSTVSPFFVMSANGKRIVYIAGVGKKDVFVVDNNIEGKHYESINNRNLTLSPDGEHLSYTALLENNLYIVEDGEEATAYPKKEFKIDFLTYNNDGSTLMYRIKKQTSGESVLVSENEIGRLYTATPIVKKGEYMIIGGVQSEMYDAVLRGLLFSKDGKRYAYSAVTDGKMFAVIDGEKEGNYSEDDTEKLTIVFSPDSKHYAYAVNRVDYKVVPRDSIPSEEDYIVGSIILDGKSMGIQYDRIYMVKFSPDNKYLTFVYKKGAEIWYDLLLVQ